MNNSLYVCYSSGIGEELAHAFAQDKVSLVLIARDEERLDKVAKECKQLGSPNVKVVQLDITDTQAISTVLSEKIIEYNVDLFIANAGIAFIPETHLLDQAQDVFKLNALGTIACIETVYKSMKQRGRGGQIAAVSSGGVFFAPPYMLAYTASKAAVMSYCRDLRILGQDDGILINTIAPGYIDTPMTSVLPKQVGFLHLDAKKHGRQVKQALEADVPLIMYPTHQYIALALASSLPPSVKLFLARITHFVADHVFRDRYKVDK
ncbi:uncharacterized protein B0P05DRAFT_367151 [Gilbertella persicaria]|uniref:uncharacterized protein n=1 Tax=Gilbertella persicaria TaxID=101096 RepID=UPI00221EAD29|nr:uncharacterized protein B0P05DRAFT_367151 [Gilbertella persicaria]KAI8047223.1 hypothetical protein B0P05DRAFT_367151 [Gilbertella persicaria]